MIDDEMNDIRGTLGSLHLGAPQSHHNLVSFPLTAAGSTAADYLLLDDALAAGCARVSEVSEAGRVSELRFSNDCDKPVLLLDGEELIGAKQNRILNLTILAPTGKTLTIPVSCVEAGRWHQTSAEFKASGRAFYASGRAGKLYSVSEALRREGSRRSDQSAVWADIADKSVRLGAYSRTAAAAEMFDAHQGRLEDYASAFCVVPGQVGAVFALNGRVAGLDIFDSEATLARLFPKLVRSYALDAIDRAGAGDVAKEVQVREFLRSLAEASVERFPAVGLGEDWRLTAPRLMGAALVVDQRVIHLCAFSAAANEYSPSMHHGSAIARFSARRRFGRG